MGFLIPKYGKFWSISPGHFIKHKPLFSWRVSPCIWSTWKQLETYNALGTHITIFFLKIQVYHFFSTQTQCTCARWNKWKVFPLSFIYNENPNVKKIFKKYFDFQNNAKRNTILYICFYYCKHVHIFDSIETLKKIYFCTFLILEV